jgi:hypothetical protein
MVGFVYIFSNPAFPTLVKIGRTSKDPTEDRLKELNTTGVPQPYRCEYYALVGDHIGLEKKLHEKFESSRTNDNREFFEIDYTSAITAIRDLAPEYGQIKYEETKNQNSEKLTKLKEENQNPDNKKVKISAADDVCDALEQKEKILQSYLSERLVFQKSNLDLETNKFFKTPRVKKQIEELGHRIKHLKQAQFSLATKTHYLKVFFRRYTGKIKSITVEDINCLKLESANWSGQVELNFDEVLERFMFGTPAVVKLICHITHRNLAFSGGSGRKYDYSLIFFDSRTLEADTSGDHFKLFNQFGGHTGGNYNKTGPI